MKTHLHSRLALILGLLFCFAGFSQDIILEFDGRLNSNNNPVDLSTLIIENLTQNTSFEVEAPFTVNLDESLGTDDFGEASTNNGFKAVYPNPFSDRLTIEFFTSGNGRSDLRVYNMLGQEVAKTSDDWSAGLHTANFTATSDGLYFVKLTDAGQTYTQKVLAQNATGNDIAFTYNGQLQGMPEANRTFNDVDQFFQPGDLLRYSATAGDMRASIYDSPTESQAYTFNFTGDFYKFDPYLVQEEYPAFVNVLFSVTDIENKGVDFLTNDDFRVLENGSPISASESARYVRKLDQVPYTQRTVLMLDKSRSVRDNLPAIKEAAISLVNILGDNQLVSVYAFAGEAELVQDFTTNTQALTDAINSIVADGATTNLYGSLITGLNSYQNLYTLDAIEEGYLIALTDGNDQANSNTVEQVVAARGSKRVFMVGLGEELNPEPLNEIANPGDFIPLTSVDNLEDVFSDINLDIVRFSNSFYFLNYLSPKRESTNEILVEAVNNDNEGDDNAVEGTFSAFGFENVVEGVYANVEPGSPYGPEDGINLEVTSQQTLTEQINFDATTYFAETVPDYEWSIEVDDDRAASNVILQVNEEDNSKASVVIFESSRRLQITVTLRDVANNYENQYTITVTDTFPTLTTKEITDIDADEHTAVSGGNVTDANGSDIVEYGIVWSQNPRPTIGNNEGNTNARRNGNTPADFTASLRNLDGDARYFVRSYALNANGYGYGNTIEFTTPSGIPLIRNSNDNIATEAFTALLTTELIDDGGEEIIERGVVFTTEDTNPTLDDMVQIDTNDSPVRNITITDLQPDTSYRARAYARNSLGVGYAINTRIFTTKTGIPNFGNSTPISDITNNSANYTANVSENGAPIIERGIVWNTETTPTIDDFSSTAPEGGEGNYEGELTGLSPETQYFYRAYAITDAGVGYGPEFSFQTISETLQSSVTLRNQADVEDFAKKEYKAVSGNVQILNTGDVNDLSLLSDLESIGGILEIRNTTQLINLTGLENLTNVGRDILIVNNSVLTSLEGLSGITSATTLQIEANENLEDFSALSNFQDIGSLVITGSDVTDTSIQFLYDDLTLTEIRLGNTTSLSALDLSRINSLQDVTLIDNAGLTTITGGEPTFESSFRLQNNDALVNLSFNRNPTSLADLHLEGNSSLTDYSGFTALQRINGDFILRNIPGLTNVSFLSNVSTIVGNAAIVSMSDLTNLDGLGNLNTIGGFFSITGNAQLNDIDGLVQLRSVGEGFSISDNSNLITFTSSIESFSGSLNITDNSKLTMFSFPSVVNSIPERTFSILIRNNQLLENLNGLIRISRGVRSSIRIDSNTSLNDVSGLGPSNADISLELTNNPSLVNLDGLEDLTSLNRLTVQNNNRLVNLDGLANLNNVGSRLQVAANQQLSDLCGLTTLVTTEGGLNDTSNAYVVSNNAFNPTRQDIIDGNCSQ